MKARTRSPPSCRMIMNPEAPFYRIPPEIWERVLAFVARSDLHSLTLASVRTYPHANPQLYNQVEISFCRCSDRYFECLNQTLSAHDVLAELVKSLVIDLTVPRHVKAAAARDDGTGSSRWQSIRSTGFDKLMQLRNHTLGGRAQVALPNTPSEWNRAAILALKNSNVERIIPRLTALSSITLILGKGRSDIDAQTVHGIFAKTAPNVLENLSSLTMQDQTFSLSPALRSLCSLRELDLSYTSMPGFELTAILEANCQTLEQLTLIFFVESKQHPIFRQSSGITLPKLKAFSFEGPQPIAGPELIQVLSQSSELHTLRVASLDLPSAAQWTEVISHLATLECTRKMTSVAFGAPAGREEFWEAVSEFLRNCGDNLQSLTINGSPRGPNVGMCEALRNALFRDLPSQPLLTKLILVWRGCFGVEREYMSRIPAQWPAVEMLHICTPFTGNVEEFIGTFQDLKALKTLHLIHPICDGLIVSPDLDLSNDSVASSQMRDSLTGSSTEFIQSFVDLAVQNFPRLGSISWALIEQNRRPSYVPLPCVFIKIHRNDGSYKLEDLGIQIAMEDYGLIPPGGFYCNVGNLKAMLPRPAGLRETMGERFREGGSKAICDYVEFPRPGSQSIGKLGS